MARVSEGRVVEITDSPARERHMTGCVKGFQMHRVLHSEKRLLRPLIRIGPRGGTEFREATWQEALDYAAERLKSIKEKYGSQSIIHLGGSGSSRGCLHNTNSLTKRFLSIFGGYTERHSSYSIGAALYVTPYILGTYNVGIDSPTLEDSKLIILLGANPSDLKTDCGLEARLREAKKRGVEIIVVDPRRSLTVKTLATTWIPIYPGTDAVMMTAILHTLIKHGMVDRGFVTRYSVGFEDVEAYILGHEDGTPKTPDWAAPICGVPAEQIEALALKYGSTHPTALIPGYSIQRTLGGEEAIRMAVTLQTATGNLGVRGGSPGCLPFGPLPKPRIGTIPIPKNPAGASIPVYRWEEVILEGRRGGYPTDIKAIYNVGGNYITQGSNTRQAIEAFNATEFNVCHDRFLTPTARYCDVIFPATTFLERNDIIQPNSGNYLLYSNRAVLPVGESRNDYDIFTNLAERLGFRDEFTEGRDEDAWLRKFVSESDIPDYDEFRRTGIWFDPVQDRVGLSTFVADPDTHPLKTPSGRIQLRSPQYAAVGGTETPNPHIPTIPEDYPLRLVSPKSRYRVHSQNANIDWFNEREKPRIWINPYDAETHGVKDGDVVEVESSIGRVRVAAFVTENIMRGVVCMLEGVWPTPDLDWVDTAGAVNMLTSTEPTMPSQASRTHSVNVRISRVNPHVRP
jgi:anaerobic dimethyl sulfoxide reductase subunit A